MLTQEQITAARKKLGVQPVQTDSVNRASELQSAWAAPEDQPQQTAPGLLSSIGTDFVQRAKNDKAINHSDQSIPSKIFQNVGQGAGFLGDIVGEGMKAVTPQPVKDALGNLAGNVAQTPEAQGLMTAWQNFKTAHPELAGNIEATGNIASILPIGEGAGLAVKGAEAAVDVGKNVVPKAVEAGKTAVLGTAEEQAAREALKNGPDLTKISDMIQPKMTIRETRLAQQQGRLFKGGPSGIFTEGSADKIAASPAQAKSAFTIGKLIEGADKMDPATLYGATQEKIGEIATKLKPEMEATPIKPETLDKISADTKELFAQQTEDALATDEPNVVKLQNNFKKFLDKSKTTNFNDLWETAKGYDASIPDKVKNANDLSSHELQMQKEIWLDNRAVLKRAINDVVDGMGKKSQEPFSDMRDLFNAQHNLDTTVKFNPEGAPSKLQQFGKTLPGKVLKGAGKAAGLGAGIHLLP